MQALHRESFYTQQAFTHSKLLRRSEYVYPAPVVPARGGAEVALGLYYKTFLIYRTCMRRAPARPVRACFVRSCCRVVVHLRDRRTFLQTSHCALHTSHFALHTPHFMHFTFTLHSSCSTLHTSSQLISSQLFLPLW